MNNFDEQYEWEVDEIHSMDQEQPVDYVVTLIESDMSISEESE